MLSRCQSLTAPPHQDQVDASRAATVLRPAGAPPGPRIKLPAWVFCLSRCANFGFWGTRSAGRGQVGEHRPRPTGWATPPSGHRCRPRGTGTGGWCALLNQLLAPSGANKKAVPRGAPMHRILSAASESRAIKWPFDRSGPVRVLIVLISEDAARVGTFPSFHHPVRLPGCRHSCHTAATRLPHSCLPGHRRRRCLFHSLPAF